jgi:hypothetical protein
VEDACGVSGAHLGTGLVVVFLAVLSLKADEAFMVAMQWWMAGVVPLP